MSGETAIIASTVASLFSLITLIVSRIKCVYKRDGDGCDGCRCGFMDKPIVDDNSELEIHEYNLSDTPVLVISKK